MQDKQQLNCFIDVETTGVDSKTHYIHQLVAKITDLKGNVLDQLELKIRPDTLSGAEPSAFEVVGKTPGEIMAYPLSQKQGYDEFTAFLKKWCDKFNPKDKLQFIAYNSDFDERFVRRLFERANDNYYGSFFWNPSLCLMKTMAFLMIGARDVYPNFKLASVCKAAGIDFDDAEAHDAMYDVDKTIELYVKVVDMVLDY